MIEKYSEADASRKLLVKQLKERVKKEIIVYRHNLMGTTVIVFNDLGKSSEDSFSYHIDIVKSLNMLLNFIEKPETFLEIEYFDKKNDQIEYTIPTRRIKAYLLDSFNFISTYIHCLDNLLFERDSSRNVYYGWNPDFNLSGILNERFFSPDGDFISAAESFKLYSDLSKIEDIQNPTPVQEAVIPTNDIPPEAESATVNAFVKEDIAIIKNPDAVKPKRKRTSKKAVKSEEVTNS